MKKQDSNKEINYNQIASVYAQHRQARQSVVDELKKGCPANNVRILEIGCGTGNYINALVISNRESCGIDPSIAMLEASQNSNYTVINANAENLPFTDNVFDFTYSVNVVHYISNLKVYYSEALRVLKPNSLMCTVTDSERIIASRKPLAEY